MAYHANSRKILWLFLPAAALYAVSLIAPLFGFLGVSFQSISSKGFGEGDLTLANYLAVVQDIYYWRSALITLRVSFAVTALCITIGYATAYLLTKVSVRTCNILITLLVFPLMISTIVRVYGWIVIFSQNGIINSVLVKLGITDSPIQLLYNETATVIGLSAILLPYAVISIATVLFSIDPKFKEAAFIHGATRWQAFLNVTLPLSRPGLVSSFALIFTLSMTTYMISLLLGGPKVKMLGNLIFDASSSFNWPLAATLSMVLVGLTLLTAGAGLSLISANSAKLRK